MNEPGTNIGPSLRERLLAHWAALLRYRFLLYDLVSRDIKVKYRRSFLGILWSVLNPLLMMLVITSVFQRIFRFEIENFPIYYLTGSLIFNFVTEATNGALRSVLDGGPLIKKVYIPKYIFPLEKCLFAFVNMLFSLVATVLMIFILRSPLHWTMLLFSIPLLYALIFSIGFGLILATMTVFFRDMIHLYSVWTTAWIYLTPIIYPVEILPNWMLHLVKFNPLYHYVNYFRNIMMYGVVPPFRTNLICAAFALVFLAAGLWMFKAKQDRFILFI